MTKRVPDTITGSTTLGQSFPVPESETDRRISLLVYHRTDVEVVPLAPEQSVTIGRTAPADIVVCERNLSRRHAMFEMRAGEVWVEDLRSTNGTWVNGEKVDRARLKIDDEVTLGPVSIGLHVMTPAAGRRQGLESDDRFHNLLDDEVVRARTFGRKLALVMVKAVREKGGRLSRWCPRIRELLRPVDRVGLYGSNVVQVLLPETDLDQAGRLAGAIVAGRASDEPPLVCGVTVFPEGGTSAEELIEVCRTALHRARADAPVQAIGISSFDGAQPDHGGGPIVCSPAMVKLYELVDRLGASAIPVLILGETGTGKEVVARAIHERGVRRTKPLRCVNCGAIPEQLIESVLFGHKRGAFTGADKDAKGIFEEADGGTVFLDEIGELRLQAQVALLRVLETKRVTPVGSNKEIETDIRVIAATNRDLEALCKTGDFRLDLFYRLSAMPVQIPPLRARTEEIKPLAEHFIRGANEINDRQVTAIAPAALGLLCRYDWPGNVRELRNVIERAVVIVDGNLINVDELPERLHQPSVTSATARGQPPDQPDDLPLIEPDQLTEDPEGEELDLKLLIERYEIWLIKHALLESGGNQSKAARLLSISRRTLVYKIDIHAIDKDGRGGDEPPPELMQDTFLDGEHDFKSLVTLYEARILRAALAEAGGNERRAASLLSIPAYTFAKKLRKHGLK